MFRFRERERILLAARADDSGMVSVGGSSPLVAGARMWVIESFERGRYLLMTHEEFMARYTPADEEAQAYLEAIADD